MNIILDLCLVLVIFGFMSWGAHRGFVKTLFGLMGTVASFVAAVFLAQPLSAFISHQFVTPMLSASATKQIADIVGVTAESPKELPLEGLFSGTHGILSEFLNRMGATTEGMQAAYDAAGGKSAGRIGAVDYIVTPAANAISMAIALILIFVLVGIIIKIVAIVASAIFQLPVLSSLNKVGGAAIGLVQGVIACVLVCLAVRFALPYFTSLRDWGITEATINNTLLFKIVYNLGFVGFLSGLGGAV